ncbi:MAG: hypothetical protein FWE36_00125 [Erysipelotrichales bacterium]|nr:hypothetical protein [Erysipelotrichales bacterium]
MNEILIDLITILITCVVLPLISFIGLKVTQYISTKTDCERTNKVLTNITQVITSNVTSALQTTVENLKKKGEFDEKAQREVLAAVSANIYAEIKEEGRIFIEENYGDLDSWIRKQIESTIYNLKN